MGQRHSCKDATYIIIIKPWGKKIDVHFKDDIEDLIRNDIELWELYQQIPRMVARSDIGRLILAKYRNGLYCDMDIVFTNDTKIDELQSYPLVLFCEHEQCNPNHMGVRENKRYTHRMYNCIFASHQLNSPFWDQCLTLCKTRIRELLSLGKEYKWSDSDVIWCTGPDLITTVYHEYSDKENIKIVSHADCKTMFNHCCAGTWRNGSDFTTATDESIY